MIESFIYLSPLLVLLVGLMLFSATEFENDEQMRCFKICRNILSLSLFLAVIFYNRPMITGLTSANKFTLVFQIITYTSALAVLYLSRKWFSNMKISGHKYCYCLITSVLAADLMIISHNILLTLGSSLLLLFSNFLMMKNAENKKDLSINVRVYLISSICFVTLMCIAAFLLYYLSNSFDYTAILAYLDTKQQDAITFTASAMFILGFIFMIGLAPMHFCLTETLGKVMLPVFAYFMLVPTAAYWAGFIRLNMKMLSPLINEFHLFYITIALLSVAVGAIGTCSGQNIRKIMAYSAVYQWGIIFLMLQYFTPDSADAAFVCLILYLLAMYGICVCLFSLKIKGEYLFMLNEFSGASTKRPYVSALFTVFLFSLLGFPPLPGFLSIFSVLNNLSMHGHYYQIVYLLTMMFFIAYAYLQIVKTFYFETKQSAFDRADWGIYALLCIQVVFMFLIVLKPHYLLENLNFMMEAALG